FWALAGASATTVPRAASETPARMRTAVRARRICPFDCTGPVLFKAPGPCVRRYPTRLRLTMRLRLRLLVTLAVQVQVPRGPDVVVFARHDGDEVAAGPQRDLGREAHGVGLRAA